MPSTADELATEMRTAAARFFASRNQTFCSINDLAMNTWAPRWRHQVPILARRWLALRGTLPFLPRYLSNLAGYSPPRAPAVGHVAPTDCP